MQKRPNETKSRAAVTILALVLGAPACSTVLGFEDPTDVTLSTSNETSCTCAPIPDGWRGPLRLEETSAAPAGCTGDFPTVDYDGHSEPLAASAHCTCACGAPTDVTCGAAEGALFTDAACTTTCADATSKVSTCAKLTSSTTACAISAVNGLRVTIPATGGACAPSTSDPEIPEATWGRNVRLCAAAAPTTCSTSCGVCIARAGANVCPVGFPVAHVGYGRMADSRSCTACSCGAPAGAECGGTVGVYSNGTCTSSLASVAANGTCVAVAPTNRVMVTVGAASGGSCAPAGGLPTGDVTAEDPTTICCARP